MTVQTWQTTEILSFIELCSSNDVILIWSEHSCPLSSIFCQIWSDKLRNGLTGWRDKVFHTCSSADERETMVEMLFPWGMQLCAFHPATDVHSSITSSRLSVVFRNTLIGFGSQRGPLIVTFFCGAESFFMTLAEDRCAKYSIGLISAYPLTPVRIQRKINVCSAYDWVRSVYYKLHKCRFTIRIFIVANLSL